jgi:hypothetical protein
MNFIKKITFLKTLVIFGVALFLNFGINLLFFYLNFIPEILSEYKKVSEFTLKQFQENKIEIKIDKSGITLGRENYLIPAKEFPIQVNSENLIYISKSSNYADFKEKNTLAILNDKELVLNLNQDYQNIPLESIVRNQPEIIINQAEVEKFSQALFNNNGEIIIGYLFTAFGIEKIVFYIAQFLWGFMIMPFIIFYVLKFSGYQLDKKYLKNYALLYYSVFLLVEPLLFYLRVPVNFVHIFILGFIIITFGVKRDLEKTASSESDL